MHDPDAHPLESLARGTSSVSWGNPGEIQCQFIILARKDEPTPDFRWPASPTGSPSSCRRTPQASAALYPCGSTNYCSYSILSKLSSIEGWYLEIPTRYLTRPRAFTTRFKPVPPPSANEQELSVIHLPNASSVRCSTLAGPTSHAVSGFGNEGSLGKNQISSNPKKIRRFWFASKTFLVGTSKPWPSGLASGRNSSSSGLV